MTEITTPAAEAPARPGPAAAVRDWAAYYLSHGFAVCRIKQGEKRPTTTGWSTRSATPDEFGPDDQIGILTGWLSDGGRPGHALVCVDLDSPEAVAAADRFLPATGMVDGRPGKPRSHRYYAVPTDTVPPADCSTAEQAAAAAKEAGRHPGPKTARFRHPTGRTHVDLLGTGAQAVCPPSVYHSGEDRAEAHLSRELDRALAQLARLRQLRPGPADEGVG